jgi:hypothetical protein
LIFTHQYNLFDREHSGEHLTPTLNMLALNVRQTVALYREFWGEPLAPVTFLTDTYCRRVSQATAPGLLKYFKKEKGMYKADMCRIAELFLHGCYYFDVDLITIHPVSPPSSVRTGWPKNEFF